MQVIRLYNETGKHVLSVVPCLDIAMNFDFVDPDSHKVITCESPVEDGSTVALELFKHMQDKHPECIKKTSSYKVETAAPETPRYEHDCTSCKFLGRFKEADLYFHPGPIQGSPGVEITVIARTGKNDYYSGLMFGLMKVASDPECSYLLREALCRALKVVEYRKLIVKHVDEYYHDRWPVLGSLISQIDQEGAR